MQNNEECFVEIIRLLDLFFDSDHEKMALWLSSYNGMFGTAAIYLIESGRAHKVLRMVKIAAWESGWGDKP